MVDGYLQILHCGHLLFHTCQQSLIRIACPYVVFMFYDTHDGQNELLIKWDFIMLSSNNPLWIQLRSSMQTTKGTNADKFQD